MKRIVLGSVMLIAMLGFALYLTSFRTAAAPNRKMAAVISEVLISGFIIGLFL